MYTAYSLHYLIWGKGTHNHTQRILLDRWTSISVEKWYGASVFVPTYELIVIVCRYASSKSFTTLTYSLKYEEDIMSKNISTS